MKIFPKNSRNGVDNYKLFSILKFLAVIFGRRPILFKNRTLDILFIGLLTLTIVLNSVVFGTVLDYVSGHSEKYNKSLFLLGFALFWGFFALLKGLFPNYNSIIFLNNKLYELGDWERYLLSLFKQTYTFTYWAMFVSCITVFLCTSTFTLLSALTTLSVIFICLHLNRCIKTFFDSRVKSSHLVYSLATLGVISLISILFNKPYLLVTAVFILFIMGKYSYEKIEPAEKISNSGRTTIPVFLMVIKAFFKNQKISSTTFVVLVVKIIFLILLASKAGTMVMGRYYLFVLFSLPCLPFNYFYNNIFGFLKNWYAALYSAPYFVRNVLKVYIIPFTLVALCDAVISVFLTLAVYKPIKYVSLNLSFSLIQFVSVYCLCLFTLLPAGIASSIYFPKKISGDFLKKNNTSFISTVITFTICAISAVLLINFKIIYLLILLPFTMFFWGRIIFYLRDEYAGKPLVI